MKLCCVFNYPPAYRTSIFKKIDETFDTQFIWAEEIIEGIPCDIKKMNYSILKKKPIINKKKLLLGHFEWVTKTHSLPFKDYDYFLITGTGSFSSIPTMLLCRLFGKKIYGWGHGHKKISGIWKPLIYLQYKLLNGYFTYGEGGRTRLIELGISSDKIFAIYNSLCDKVDPQERLSCKSDVIRRHFNNDFPTILFVGRLTKVKQLDWLIKAKLALKEKGVEYNLLIIGDGPIGKDLHKLVEDNSIDNEVWFYGECYDENQLNTLIYNSDLCVSPGNVGLTALHSLMYGTPVLSHDNFELQMPEYETIIEGKTGSLYKYGSFTDFCNKIELWLKVDKDRDEIRHNCYEMINGKWNSIYQINLLQQVFS